MKDDLLLGLAIAAALKDIAAWSIEYQQGDITAEAFAENTADRLASMDAVTKERFELLRRDG